MACSVVAIIAGWLGSRKFIGHRLLLWTVCVFALTRSATSISLMISTYQDNHVMKCVTYLLTASCLAGLTLAMQLLVSAGNLLFTFTLTEARDLVREENDVNERMKRAMFEHLAQENRISSTELLGKAAAREARTSG